MPSNAPIGDDEAEFQKFAMDLGGSLVPVFFLQSSDENLSAVSGATRRS